MTGTTALAGARRRDVARRRHRVHQALAEMRAQVAEITISAVAARARVHRSFIHRHPDLAPPSSPPPRIPPPAAQPQPTPSAADRCWPTTPTSVTAAAASNSTPAASKTGLSELLGTQISQRTGLGPRPTSPR